MPNFVDSIKQVETLLIPQEVSLFDQRGKFYNYENSFFFADKRGVIFQEIHSSFSLQGSWHKTQVPDISSFTERSLLNQGNPRTSINLFIIDLSIVIGKVESKGLIQIFDESWNRLDFFLVQGISDSVIDNRINSRF